MEDNSIPKIEHSEMYHVNHRVKAATDNINIFKAQVISAIIEREDRVTVWDVICMLVKATPFVVKVIYRLLKLIGGHMSTTPKTVDQKSNLVGTIILVMSVLVGCIALFVPGIGIDISTASQLMSTTDLVGAISIFFGVCAKIITHYIGKT